MPCDLTGPVIVTGPLRSGVRLLAAVLDGHPQLSSGPELPFIHTFVRQARDIELQIGANLARHHGIPATELRVLFGETIAALVSARSASAEAGRFVLHSFAAATALEDYAAVLPQARFIFMLRDARAIAASLRRCRWRDPRSGGALPYTRDGAIAARHVRDLVELARGPVARLSKSGQLLVVRYETFCRSPEHEFARIAGFLAVRPESPRVNLASATRVTAATDNEHPPLRPGPVTAASVNAWRTRLSVPEVAVIDRLTHGVLDGL